MKVVLSIGGHLWIAPDMTKAAKAVDLLNSFKPANQDYRNSGKEVYVIGKGRDHEMAIKELREQAIVVDSIAKAIALRGIEDSKERGLL